VVGRANFSAKSRPIRNNASADQGKKGWNQAAAFMRHSLDFSQLFPPPNVDLTEGAAL